MKKILVLFFIVLVSTLPSNASIIDLFKKQKPPQPVGQGYKGTLPDIERYFEYKNANTKSLPNNKIKTGPVDGDFLLDAPFDDNTYLDVIVKKEKNSPYVNDVMQILPLLVKFKASVEAGEDIQKFNANVNVLDLYVRGLQTKYGNKVEAHKESYQVLQEINYRAKLLGNLKFDANFYSKYMPLMDEAYSPKGIAKQDKILIDELERAINILKTAN